MNSSRIERILDKCGGDCLLRDARIAQVVASALAKFDGSRYHLFAWCVMPNHVHVVFQPRGESTLEGILHTWKSYSAKNANKILRRSGDFWPREYYDHLIRNIDEFERAVRYVVENPAKAGLENWPWAWSYQ